MSTLNSSLIKDPSIVRPDFFSISGLVGIPQAKYYYFCLCFLHVVTVMGNTFVMFMIYTDHCLHSPKYISVFNLALSDLCGSTAVVPQVIDTFLSKSHLISYQSCLTHMFFVLAFFAVQSYTLTVLSFDRFVAICLPLSYSEIVTNKSMLVITAISWIVAGLAYFIPVFFVSRLSFCRSTVIHSYYCDHGVIYRLACNDYTPTTVILKTHPLLTSWLPVIFITGTYICIGRALLKIAAASERLKAMKTCTSHLILVSVFYLPYSFSLALGPTIHQNTRIINMSLSTILPPMLNPIIYTLKTEEFRESVGVVLFLESWACPPSFRTRHWTISCSQLCGNSLEMAPSCSNMTVHQSTVHKDMDEPVWCGTN